MRPIKGPEGGDHLKRSEGRVSIAGQTFFVVALIGAGGTNSRRSETPDQTAKLTDTNTNIDIDTYYT